ncbi:hypothetical protein ACI7YW_09665 [Clostridium ljungdahlii]
MSAAPLAKRSNAPILITEGTVT